MGDIYKQFKTTSRSLLFDKLSQKGTEEKLDGIKHPNKLAKNFSTKS